MSSPAASRRRSTLSKGPSILQSQPSTAKVRLSPSLAHPSPPLPASSPRLLGATWPPLPTASREETQLLPSALQCPPTYPQLISEKPQLCSERADAVETAMAF